MTIRGRITGWLQRNRPVFHVEHPGHDGQWAQWIEENRMADEHKHNTDGRTESGSVTIGTELVGFTKVFCTCGQLQQNNVTSRTPIAPRQSPENK